MPIADPFLVGRRALACAALLAGLSSAPALSSSLVADINQAGDPSADLPVGGVYAVDGRLLFRADDGLAGIEPWISNGTAAGTQRLATVQPGTSTAIGEFIEMGGEAFFKARTSGGYCEVFKSDLTPGHAVQVTTLGIPGHTDCPFGLTAAGGFVYFVRSGSTSLGNFGMEIWRTDGTPGNQTVMETLAGPNAPTSIFELTAVGDDLFYVANEPTHGTELYRITPAGLVQRVDAVDDPGPATEDFTSPSKLFNVNDNNLLFRATDATNGSELWRTDGTTTTRIELNPGPSNSYPDHFVVFDSAVYFSATASGSGEELWRFDGSTPTLIDLEAGAGSSSPRELVVLGEALFFFADEGSGLDLWISDGSTGGSLEVYDLPPFDPEDALADVQAGASHLCFFIRRGLGGPVELWSSDGTGLGTQLLRVFDDYEEGVAVLDGDLYFNATTTADGAELWTSDGTVAGTVMVTSFAAPGSKPSDFTVLGDSVFVVADDGVHGQQVWFSDGTAVGTNLRLDANPTGGPVDGLEGAAYGAHVYYAAETAAHGREVHRMDAITSSPLFDVFSGPGHHDPEDFFVGAGRIFWRGINSSQNLDLYSTDGTSLAAIDVTPGSSDSPNDLTELDGFVYLSAWTGPATGIEIVRTDGLAGSWSLVTDFFDGAGNGPSEVAAGLGRLFFSAGDAAGREPWVSDGTTGGTLNLADLSSGNSNPRDFIESNGTVFFFAFETTSNLYTTDGTPAGTHLLTTEVVPPGVESKNAAATAGGLVFVKDDPVVGEELHFSDGTTVTLLKDIHPGPLDSEIAWMVSFGAEVYFVADDGIHGAELWVTDGTSAGTRLLLDIHPGPESSRPYGLTVAEQTLFFGANDGVTGAELHRFRPTVFEDGFESGSTSAWQ